MKDFHTKIGSDGRIFIPADCRHELQLKTGDELVIQIRANAMHIHTFDKHIKDAQARIKQITKNKNLVDELKKMRAEDLERD